MIRIQIGKGMKIEGAVVILLDQNDKTLILLRPAEAKWAPLKWGYPGGKIEPGEDALDAAVRETKEETALDARSLILAKLKVDKPVEVYYTRDYSGTVRIDHEHNDWAWVSHDELKEYDLAPQVLEMYEWVLKNE